MPRNPRPAAVKQPAAVGDLVEIADYLARSASLTVANHFLAAVKKTIRQLAKMPEMDTPWGSEKPRLAGMRFFPVTRFRNHLLFYRPIKGGVELVRVFHGAQDIAGILDEDEDEA